MVRFEPEAAGDGDQRIGDRRLYVQPAGPGGYALPKSGTVTRPELVEHINSAGIVLPARYIMRREDNCWVAELQAPTTKKHPPAKNPRKISKSAEESILNELKDGKRR